MLRAKTLNISEHVNVLSCKVQLKMDANVSC